VVNITQSDDRTVSCHAVVGRQAALLTTTTTGDYSTNNRRRMHNACRETPRIDWIEHTGRNIRNLRK